MHPPDVSFLLFLIPHNNVQSFCDLDLFGKPSLFALEHIPDSDRLRFLSGVIPDPRQGMVRGAESNGKCSNLHIIRSPTGFGFRAGLGVLLDWDLADI